MGRPILLAGLILGAVVLAGSTAAAQGYGRFAKPRSFHPRSGYGYYRSYPHNYAEYNLRGYGRGLGGYGRGLGGYGWGVQSYGRPTYVQPRYGLPGYGRPGFGVGRPGYGRYPAQRNYGQTQFQFNFGR